MCVCVCVFGLILFYGISTIAGHFIPHHFHNSILNIYDF